MNRNIEKAIEEHHSMYNEVTGRACFYHSDYIKLLDLANKDSGGRIEIFDLMSKCLAAGYAIGYRAGRRNTQRRRNA